MIQDPGALNQSERDEDKDGRMMGEDPDNRNDAQTLSARGTEDPDNARGSNNERETYSETLDQRDERTS